MYVNKGRIIAPYLKMVNHDKNPAKQEDNSHKGIYLEQFLTKIDLYLLITEKNYLMDHY